MEGGGHMWTEDTFPLLANGVSLENCLATRQFVTNCSSLKMKLILIFHQQTCSSSSSQQFGRAN